MKNSRRLDAALVDLGLAASRERARALVLAGRVTVNGQPVSKAGAPVRDDDTVALLEPDHPYVSRGGVKLAHALDSFSIGVDRRLALDIGASTGGFTDVLLQRTPPASSRSMSDTDSWTGSCGRIRGSWSSST